MGIGVHVLGHPVVLLQRDRAGRLTGVGEGTNESFIHIEIDRSRRRRWRRSKSACRPCWPTCARSSRTGGNAHAHLEVAEELPSHRIPVSDAGRAEAQEFLRWAADNHFTFFGYREYTVEKQGKDQVSSRIPNRAGPAARQGRRRPAPAQLARRALHAAVRRSRCIDPDQDNARSSVHRPGYMDYIGVLAFDAKGQPIREQRFLLGLYTSSAYNRRPWDSRWCASATST